MQFLNAILKCNSSFAKMYFLDLSPSIRIKDWWPQTNANISQSVSIHLDDSYFWFVMFYWTNTRYRNTSPANNCLYNAGHIFRSTCSTLKLLCWVSTVSIYRQFKSIREFVEFWRGIFLGLLNWANAKLTNYVIVCLRNLNYVIPNNYVICKSLSSAAYW